MGISIAEQRSDKYVIGFANAVPADKKQASDPTLLRKLNPQALGIARKHNRSESLC
jgi:hypothetical protein